MLHKDKVHEDQSPKVERLVQFIAQVVRKMDEREQKPATPLVLSPKDAADLMGISVPTLREHFLCRPDFPKIRAGVKYLIPYQALLQWLNQQV